MKIKPSVLFTTLFSIISANEILLAGVDKLPRYYSITIEQAKYDRQLFENVRHHTALDLPFLLSYNNKKWKPVACRFQIEL